MEQPTRRQRRQLETRQRIIQVAAELFRTQGFDATTTDQVAARADVAKGTVFRYAPTKAHLLALVYEEDLGRLVAQAFAAIPPDAPMVEVLAGVFAPFYRLYEQHPDLARQFVRDQLFIAPHLVAIPGALQRLGRELTALIQRWQEDGRVAADIDAGLAAQGAFALYFSVLVAWLSGWLPLAQRDQQLRASLALYWRGLLNEPDT